MSALSKPFEKHINKHILAHFNKNKLFHPNQSEFREHHSCHTALTSLADQWLSSINDNTFCGALFLTLLIGCALFVDFANIISSLENWQCMDCLRGHLSKCLRHFLQIESKLCMSMHPHPLYDFSNMEFPKVLFLDHYLTLFHLHQSMTSLYSSRHVENFSQMTQQSTAVTLISESYRSHYKRVFAVY